jgi:hypothetical protein
MTSKPGRTSTLQESGPKARLTGYMRIAVGLLAVYGPVILALTVDRWIGGKIYFVLALWATEGILWYWHETRTERRRRRELGIWRPEH